MQTLMDIIRNRYSCRNYSNQRVNELTQRELLSYINTNNIGLWGEKIELAILEVGANMKQPMKLDYGAITNHNTYLVGNVKKGSLNRMSYGFAMEKAVLKATSLGLNSCWIGYFNKNYFEEINLTEDQEIPSIVIIGYADRESLTTRMMRFAVGAKKRKDFDELFFLNSFDKPMNKIDSDIYSDALEAVRLAPSSGNTQPWRVLFEEKNKTFHFYKKIISRKYEQMGLHDVDLGIALSHFEIIANFNNLKGIWERRESQLTKVSGDEVYMISWINK